MRIFIERIREHTRLKVVTNFDCKTWVPTNLDPMVKPDRSIVTYSFTSFDDLHKYLAAENWTFIYFVFFIQE